jgi:hypothetical protein
MSDMKRQELKKHYLDIIDRHKNWKKRARDIKKKNDINLKLEQKRIQQTPSEDQLGSHRALPLTILHNFDRDPKNNLITKIEILSLIDIREQVGDDNKCESNIERYRYIVNEFQLHVKHNNNSGPDVYKRVEFNTYCTGDTIVVHYHTDTPNAYHRFLAVTHTTQNIKNTCGNMYRPLNLPEYDSGPHYVTILPYLKSDNMVMRDEKTTMYAYATGYYTGTLAHLKNSGTLDITQRLNIIKQVYDQMSCMISVPFTFVLLHQVLYRKDALHNIFVHVTPTPDTEAKTRLFTRSDDRKDAAKFFSMLFLLYLEKEIPYPNEDATRQGRQERAMTILTKIMRDSLRGSYHPDKYIKPEPDTIPDELVRHIHDDYPVVHTNLTNKPLRISNYICLCDDTHDQIDDRVNPPHYDEDGVLDRLTNAFSRMW